MEKRTIFITRGLPASGKSTYAKEYVTKNQDTKRINRDDLRHMLNGYVLTWENQNLLTCLEQDMMKSIIVAGYNLILDNMFIRAAEMENLASFVNGMEMEFMPNMCIKVVIVDFTDVPLETCIARDAKRERPTQEHFIRSLHQTYLDENDKFMELFEKLSKRKEK